MTLLKAIYKIIDFDEQIPSDLVIEEFNKKYSNTWCLVDSTPIIIDSYRNGLLSGFTEDLKEIQFHKISSIKAIKPKTGLYKTNGSLFYISKWPVKQWKRSFCSDNHKVVCLDPNLLEKFSINLLITNKYTYAKESIIYKNIVFLHTLAVGLLKNGTIVVYNPNFYNELKEIWKQYNLILDINAQEESLEKEMPNLML